MQKRKVLHAKYLPLRIPNPLWLLVVPMLVEFWKSASWITPMYVTLWVVVFILFTIAKLTEQPVDL